MIEAAIILTSIFLMTFGMADVALLAVAYVETNRAIDSAARCGAVTYEWPSTSAVCPNLNAYAQSKMIITKNVVFSSEVPTPCGIQPDGQTSYGAKVTGKFTYSPLITKSLGAVHSISICYPVSFTTTSL